VGVVPAALHQQAQAVPGRPALIFPAWLLRCTYTVGQRWQTVAVCGRLADKLRTEVDQLDVLCRRCNVMPAPDELAVLLDALEGVVRFKC
jgi:hypothetical protein